MIKLQKINSPQNHLFIDGIGTCYWYHWKGHQKNYLNAYIYLHYELKGKS